MFDILRDAVAQHSREVVSSERALERARERHAALESVLDSAEHGLLRSGSDSLTGSAILAELQLDFHRLRGQPLTSPVSVNTLVYAMIHYKRVPDICVHEGLQDSHRERRLDIAIRLSLGWLAKQGKIRLWKEKDVWHAALTPKTAKKLQAQREAQAEAQDSMSHREWASTA